MGERRAIIAAVACAAALAHAGACSHAWDALDPTGGASAGGAGTTTTSAHGGRGGSSSSSSSSSGSGGALPGRCGGTDILSWDFSTDQVDLWDRDPEFHLSGGEGVLSPPANASTKSWAAVYTPRRYDLRGDRVYLHVLEVPNQSAGAWGGILINYDNDDDLFLQAWNGELGCGFDRGGNEVIPSKVPYDPDEHRFWQLREDQGTIFCETSKDGASWTSIGSFEIGASLLPVPSAIQVVIYSGTPDHVGAPGNFRFDDLNGGGPATGGWCRAQSYTDDFNAGSDLPPPAWLRSYDYNGASYDHTGEQLNFHVSNSDSGAGYQSSVSYDITGQRIAIEVLAVPDDANAGVYFGEGNNDDFEVYWDMSVDGIRCAYDDNDQSHTIWQGQPLSVPTWVGLREAGGKTYCEIFENGAWKSYGSAAVPVDPTHVDVYFGIWADLLNDAGSYLGSFDKYNLAAVEP